MAKETQSVNRTNKPKSSKAKSAITKKSLAKTFSKNSIQQTDTDKIHALEEQLAQREAEIVRLSTENQLISQEKDQRATELQIINNIGQTLTEGLDLNNTLKRVGDRLREILKVETVGISVWDENIEHIIARYSYRNGKPTSGETWDVEGVKLALRLSARGDGRSWVVTKNVEKAWRKFGGGNEVETPKSFVQLPLLAGGKFVGGITIADYESEDAFKNISINMLETIASNLGTAIQNVRLFDETQRLLKETDQRATELQIINNIGQTLTEGFDLQSTLERVGERLREALKIDSIAVAAFAPNSDHVIAQYYYHYGERIIPDQVSTEKSRLAIRLAARRAGRSWVVNTDAEKYYRKFAVVGVPKSFVMLPLLAGKEVIGGIVLADYKKENAFTDLPISMLETIASNMGTAIQNVRLFDETQSLLKETEQRATELQIINNIGQTLTESGDLESIIQRVGERIQEALNVNNIIISIFDRETERVIAPYMVRNGEQITLTEENFDIHSYKLLIRASARRGGISWVFKDADVEKVWRKCWRGPIADDFPKSVVYLPFLVGGEIIGGISLADYESENAFSDLSVNLLETIASNMGTAIQNVRLFDETQRLLKETEQRATELQIINNIGQTMTEGLDLNTTLERVGERLREALGAKSIAIVAFDPKAGLAISNYLYHYGRQIIPQRFSMSNYKYSMRFASKVGSKPWVVNADVERYWKKFGTDILTEWTEIPKAFVIVPMLAGRDLVGSITIADYENEDAFVNLPLNLLETIASNMGTVIQNVRLFDETQRLLKETEQRATELQIINNIGQMLTEGLDLQSTLERVGERLREVLKVDSLGIIANNTQTGLAIAHSIFLKGKRIIPNRFSLGKNLFGMQFAARVGGEPLVVNSNVEKNWRRFIADVPEYAEIPKSFVIMPLLAGKELVGSITIADYEDENAFRNLPINLLETIASNMGTAIQNVRLFDETQRLLIETEQRATELQIINNIGQTLTEGLDLNSTLERVGERLGEALKFENFGIVAFDAQTELALAFYLVRKGKQVDPERFLLDKYRLAMRLASRREGKPWVVNTNAEKYWIKFGTVLDDEIAKSFVMFPLLAGRDLVGSITIADYERENAFVDFPISLIETIASNIGTVIQNVRLFDETQRLLKETEQRATELQIVNNIGQTLSEGGDLENMIQRVGERIQEALNINNIAMSIFDIENERVIAPYMVRNGEQIKLTQENYDLRRYRILIHAWARAENRGTSWVINKDIDKMWRKGWLGPVADDVPKSLVALPLLAGGEIIGGILLVDYEKENAFTDISINLLETIASNMGTAVQNVRLFDETKKLFKEAEESRTSAEQANKAKSTFLANMSHELRTPLNAIIGFTRIVKKKAEGALPDKQIENLEKVLISSEHLLGLINTVLDIAKIEAGRMDVIPSKFSLSALTDQCATLATPLLKPNVKLEKQVDETLGLIFSDQDKIKQIVLNLLSNAAKFTHDGRILLSAQKVSEEFAGISVKDSGIGISEEALGRVFEEFQQADTSTTREYGGTGLGLAISRSLAHLLGGDLTATSELGVGSTFTLTFPIKYGKKSAFSPNGNPDSVQSTESHSQTDSSEQPQKNVLSKTILIVEDTELNIDVLTQLLENEYNLLIAKDGAQGVSMAEENKPDLILMDISLPVMDGYEATRRIRKTMKSTPILGLSAHAMSGDAEKAKEAGCDDYLTKPVDEVLLIEKLNQYLR